MPKVVILGGGVAGLSAAHELVQRGFAVAIYERGSSLGGKARSYGKPGTGTGGRRALPGEHGFRFFPGFYKHVIDTMSRIPFSGNPAGVKNNLVVAHHCAMAQEGKALFPIPVSAPSSLAGWVSFLRTIFSANVLGLAPGEANYFIAKLVTFMGSCDDRRNEQYEQIAWWSFVDANSKSAAYRKVMAEGLTRSLVAMKSQVASTKTIGNILSQMIFDLGRPGGKLDSILDGPTNDVWITPWENHLIGTGLCSIIKNVTVERLDFAGGRITGVGIKKAGASSTVQGDFYISAVPVEVMSELLNKTPSILAAAPSLQNIDELDTDWMNGIQFYLKDDVPIVHGHVICLDSPWALTCISQAQFWTELNMGDFGDGTVKGVLSVDISDWKTPGSKTTAKAAEDCTAQEIADECWAQLKHHFAATGHQLHDSNLVEWFLDPSIRFPLFFRGVTRIGNWRKLKISVGEAENIEPLLINTVGSHQHRPEAWTEIPNLFLASDYVRTYTDLACMEAANEAARRAVNRILVAVGSSAMPCGVWPLSEPAELNPLKQIDQIAYDLGLDPIDFVQLWGL